jgi:hypothetical protein
VLLAYRVPRTPSTPRIAIWRRLRRLGVAQLGDGLVALPLDARSQEQLEWVADDVEAAGGSALLWVGETLSLRDQQRLVADLAAARAREYRQVIDRARSATAEPGRLLVQLRRELRTIGRRDYFPPAESELARAAVQDLAREQATAPGHAPAGAPA